MQFILVRYFCNAYSQRQNLRDLPTVSVERSIQIVLFRPVAGLWFGQEDVAKAICIGPSTAPCPKDGSPAEEFTLQ